MKNHSIRVATRTGRKPSRLLPAVAALCLAALTATPARAAAPPALRGPIATMGHRSVDALDIQQAARSLGDDPLKKRDPARWRRMLLDRCVDRELLSGEAERRGLAGDPAVKAVIEDRTFLRLYELITTKVLIPGIDPTPALLDSLQRSGLYRLIDLDYILIPDNAQQANQSEATSLAAKIRAGTVSFEAAAKSFSSHPSRSSGGHIGRMFIKDLDPRSHSDVLAAKPGDVLGPYSGPYGHEIYGVGGFSELTRDSLYRYLRADRERGMVLNYEQDLLTRYHFSMNPQMVDAVIFATASESVDSILASLGPDGTRERHGVRPALGVIARVDGDSLHFPEFLTEGHPASAGRGRLRIRDAATLERIAGHAFFRRLLVRDAHDRGLTDDPRIARDLRLIRDRAATEAMVDRAVSANPSPGDLRAWFGAHAARYRRPAASRVRAVAFASRDSAAAMLRAWNGVGISDSAVAALRLAEQPRATAETLFPGHAATLTLLEGEPDPLSRSARTLDPGMVTPVVETAQGYVVAQVLGREAGRPYSMEEVIDRVRRDWREEKKNAWVQNQLERLRAATPAQIIPARLEAVKLGPARGTAGSAQANP